MPPRRKPLIPPVRVNADGTGFQRVDEPTHNRANFARLAPPTATSTSTTAEAGGRRGAQGERTTRGPRRAQIPNADADTTGSSNSEFTSAAASSSSSSSSSPAANASPRATQQTQTKTTQPRQGNTKQTPTTTKQSAKPQSAVPSAGHAKDAAASSPPPSTSNTTAKLAHVTITVDESLLSSEAKLSPSRCRQLGVASGALVSIRTNANTTAAVVVVVAEVIMSTGLAAETVALNNDAASFFTERSVVVETVALAAAQVPSVRAVTVDVRARHLTDNGLSPSPGSCLQWSALFRRHFQHRLVYDGMRATMRLATQVVEVEVTKLASTASSSGGCPLDFGVVSDATQVDVTVAPAASQGPLGSTAENAASCRDTCDHQQQLLRDPSGKRGHVLVVGGAGTGKTFQLEQLTAMLEREGRPTLHVRVEDIPQGEHSEVHSASVIVEVFDQARRLAPCAVSIDDVDLLCGATSSSSVGSHWAMSLVATTVCEQLRQIRRAGVDVLVLASAASKASVHPSLLSPHYLGGLAIDLAPPASAEERIQCFQSCLHHLLSDNAYNAIPSETRDALGLAVADAHGYTQRDLHRVAQAALLNSFESRGAVRLELADVAMALKLVRPSALRQFEVSVPDVTWDDIGGSADAKRTLQEVVEWCLGKQSWIFTQFNITPPKGVLLYGPPGCSKTMLAKALANESRMNFVSVKGPEIFSKWVGDSEKAIREIFARARAASPCVVFIDELDGMCGHRGRGGVSDRVVSQFLTELDGLPAAFASQDTALVFVAATNRPDSIDEAVLRPGRIDRLVYVGLPELNEREAIVAIQFKQLPTAPDLSPQYVAERTEGYTGAEVVAVVKESAFVAVSANMQAPYITTGDIDVALKKVLPRIAPKEVAWYHDWAHAKR